MGTTKIDLFKYPVYKYVNGALCQVYVSSANHNIFEVQVHHYIEQGWIKLNKLKFKEIEHLQKLFIIPTEMHMDIHNRHSKFLQKWGIPIEEFIYGECL